MQAFATLESNFPKFFAQYRPDCIRLAVHVMSRLVPYHWEHVVKQDTVTPLADDYDGELVFGSLNLEILSFLTPSSRSRSVKSLWVKTEGEQEVATDLLAELVRATAGVMQVTWGFVSLAITWELMLEAWLTFPVARMELRRFSVHCCG